MIIGIIGSGTMGAGIAQVFAQNDNITEVYLTDLSEDIASKGKGRIIKNLNRLVSKNKIDSDEATKIASKIITGTIEATKDADFIIEAAVENIDIKKSIFLNLDTIVKNQAVFATNTSSLSITEIGTGLKHQLIGMHFFNPAPVMKLVEVTGGMNTPEEVIDNTMELARLIGKTPVKINEAPGFIVNRILIPMINEAVGIYAEGVASAEDIDTAMKLGANHPMGPLELGDLIGLDVVLAIMEVLQNETGDSKYRPHPLLRKMVRANRLGRKTGEGFYKY